MTIDEVAAELYGVPPAGFTEQRDARAWELRDAGSPDVAEAIKHLRRPTVSAWLVDALVRHRPDEVAALLELGDRMRAATAGGDPVLRVLAEQRRTAIGTLVAAAREVARDVGVAVSATAEQEVTSTLEAATASPDAARAVASGRLVRPIRYGGFGDVAFSDVVALPDRLPEPPPAGSGSRPGGVAAPARPSSRERAAGKQAAGKQAAAERPVVSAAALAQAQREARAASDAADDAQRRYEQRHAEAQRAEAALAGAAREVVALRERLAAAQDAWATARAALRDVKRSARQAQEAARAAHAAAAAARERLAALTGSGRVAAPARETPS
ncbi:MAG TPA: hypothetical protein VKP64_05040 [Mycobacteriales bacterium]|nr:hypothetical protein [Mycobacteriales bacterium]